MARMRRSRRLAYCCLLLACSCASELVASQPDAQLAFDGNSKNGLVVLGVTPRTGVVITGGECDQYGWARSYFPTRQHFWSAEGYIVATVTPTQAKEAYAVVAVRPERFTSLADEKPFTYATVLWPRFLFDRGGDLVGAASMLALGPASLLGAGLILATAASSANGDLIVWGDEDKGEFAYSPPGGDDLPTFTAAPGEAAYVGALRVEASIRDGSRRPPKNIAVTPIRSPDDLASAAQFMAAHYPNVRVPLTYRPIQMVTRAEPSDDEL
jgi:hypothetical protein